ncbi:hypothetical protein BCEP27_80375 [Burkholderia cepacia]
MGQERHPGAGRLPGRKTGAHPSVDARRPVAGSGARTGSAACRRLLFSGRDRSDLAGRAKARRRPATAAAAALGERVRPDQHRRKDARGLARGVAARGRRRVLPGRLRCLCPRAVCRARLPRRTGCKIGQATRAGHRRGVQACRAGRIPFGQRRRAGQATAGVSRLSGLPVRWSALCVGRPHAHALDVEAEAAAGRAGGHGALTRFGPGERGGQGARAAKQSGGSAFRRQRVPGTRRTRPIVHLLLPRHPPFDDQTARPSA